MPRRKPRGTNGPIHIISGAGHKFVPIEHPDDKAGIERAILGGALAASKAQGIPLYDLVADPVQNDENDFDFTLPSAEGEEYLDLVEVVLPGGYSGASASIEVGQFADHMFALVKAKANKYGMRRRSVIHLMLYSTDWKFLPSESVIALLSMLCSRRQHGFKTIAVVSPIDADASVLWRPFPSTLGSQTLRELEAEEPRIRRRVLHQLGPMTAKPARDGHGISWDLPE